MSIAPQQQPQLDQYGMSVVHAEDATQMLFGYRGFVASRTKMLPNMGLDLHHAATGMATEAGECLGTTKKLWIYSQPLSHVNKEGKTNYANLVEEAGDTLFYIQMLCNHLNIGLAELMTSNVKKLSLRYPSGYSDAAATERADKA